MIPIARITGAGFCSAISGLVTRGSVKPLDTFFSGVIRIKYPLLNFFHIFIVPPDCNAGDSLSPSTVEAYWVTAASFAVHEIHVRRRVVASNGATWP